MSPISAGWRPEEHWEPLPGGRGPSTAGLWIDRSTDPVSVVKRVRRPAPGDPTELDDPGHAAWWRRPALVAASGVVTATPGLRALPALELSEDDDGYVVREPLTETEELPGPFLAASLARFAAARPPAVDWLARDPLGDRLTRVAWAGGWRTLARTGAADVADRLWARRRLLLARTGELPQVLQHGDPVPANFARRAGPAVIAHDWGGLGLGPVGADLGYLSLSSRESLEVLASVYHQELPRGLCTLDDVMLAARVTSVYTVLNRAEWALSRVADGEGPLGAKLRHPSVAPSLRALQRQATHVEALLGV